MGLTKGQKRCVETLDKPLVVSAGAGSGKTFTLTRRIVHALTTGYVQDINQVLAITFTSKAAGEIRSRVKGALRAEGLMEQALRVDGAWISTIHGMCSRILRNHAVELGIDPAFTVLGEDAAKRMMDEALDDALRLAKEQTDNSRLVALFQEYKPRSSGDLDSGVSVDGCVRTLVERACAHPDGFEGMVFPPCGTSAVKSLAALVDLADEALVHAQSQKESARSTAFINATIKAQEQARAIMESKDAEAHIMEAINAFPMPTSGFGNAEYKEYVKQEAAPAYSACVLEALYTAANAHLETMVGIAREAYRLFNEAKAELGVLDNNDLLVHAYRALMHHPSIARDYENRFKIIMVDEFQDTDQLQIDMIMRLAGTDGERLCVVGDAQQSIYRFRGADVSVYNRHMEHVLNDNPEGVIELPDNFRSSGDILSFVDRIFEKPEAFGSSFMSLKPGRDETKVKAPYRVKDHRIEVQLVTKPYRGCDLDTVEYAARGIAQRFSELREAGHSAGEMVVLLRAMTKADVYAQALRDAGFACVIAGGSVFNRAPEVSLMVALAQALTNPRDTEQLFTVLSSDMFTLSADDLVQLSTMETESGLVRRGLNYGLKQLFIQGMHDESMIHSSTLRAAVDVMGSALYAVGKKPLSAVMLDVVRDSGYLTALEKQGAEGQAIAGNVLKVIRLCEGIEQESARGAASVADQLQAYIASSKEPPGALSVKGNEFVRIMTIHASKGLEFPIVAVAELPSSRKKAHGFMAETLNGKTYVSLSLGNTLSQAESNSVFKKATSAALAADNVDPVDMLFDATSPATFKAALQAYSTQEENAEFQRLLYVALTRAKEALVVSMRTKIKKDCPNGIEDGLCADIQRALCEPGHSFEFGHMNYPYGGTNDALVIATNLMSVQDELERKAAEERAAIDEQIALEACAQTDDDGDLAAGENKTTGSISDVAVWELPCVPALIYEGVQAPRKGSSLHCKELPSSGKSHDVFSYSSLSESGLECDDDDTRINVIGDTLACVQDGLAIEQDPLDEDALTWQHIRRMMSDPDKATDFGTAFHRLAQLAVLQRSSHNAMLVCPSDERIDAMIKAQSLEPALRPRLVRALTLWFESELAHEVAGYSDVVAEEPFFVRIDEGTMHAYLEGEMDLVARRGLDKQHILIVDYKTGGEPTETEHALKKKHLLQSACYAYTVLCKGYQSADLVFVRVEQASGEQSGILKTCEPQYVHYHYDACDIDELKKMILSVYKG